MPPVKESKEKSHDNPPSFSVNQPTFAKEHNPAKVGFLYIEAMSKSPKNADKNDRKEHRRGSVIIENLNIIMT